MATADLCATCGLCCNGWIFRSIKIPAALARTLKVHASDDDTLVILPQPCLFHGGDHCRCYDDRPPNCRAFFCETLKRVRSAEMTETEAQAVVARAREQVAAIDAALRRSGWAEPDEPGALAWWRFLAAAREHSEDADFRRRHEESLLLAAAYITSIQRSFVADDVF